MISKSVYAGCHNVRFSQHDYCGQSYKFTITIFVVFYCFCLFQDSIDLFLGNFAVDESDGPTPLRVQKDWKFLTVSVFVFFSVIRSSRDFNSV